MLVVENISVAIGGKTVVSGANCNVKSGEIVGLVGPNGAGKTTLVRAMCRLIAPSAGRVTLDGAEIGELSRRDLARRIAYLPQGHELHWRLDVEHLVALGRMPHQGAWGGASAEDRRAVAAAIERAELTPFAKRPVETLSGGERARATLARVLAVEAEFILADEPVAALDPYHALHVMELLRDLAREGRAVVAVLHDLSLAMRFCDRLVLMNGGEVVGEGAPQDVLALEPLGQTYNVHGHYGRHEDEPYLVPWRRLGRRDGQASTTGT